MFAQQNDNIILPLAKRINERNDRLYVGTAGHNGFRLVGSGEPYDDCGTILPLKTVGCLEVKNHTQTTLDRGFKGQVVIKIAQRDCMRAECPQHYHSWANKEADNITHRIENYYQYKTGASPLHLTVSVPINEWYLDFAKMRQKANKLALLVGFRGGCCVYHPFRQEKWSKRWYYSPHFHIIGFGFIQGTDKVHKDTGWVIKNLGRRKSVRATAFYQLSHCGISGKHHTVVWFGCMSYNKFKCPDRPDNLIKCPICGLEMLPVKYVGNDENFYDNVRAGNNYDFNKEDWVYCMRNRTYT